MTRLVALAEAYPDLKASENFRDLHNKLVDTENQIQFARRYYNGAVNLLNNRIQRFPDLLIANTFGFKLAEFFDLDGSGSRQGAGRGVAMSLVRALLVWMLCASAVLADERILSFDETVTVQNDGTLTVREIIRVRAEGRNIRRGIYRDFPTTYPGNGRQIVVGFSFESATRDGQDEPWRTEPCGNGVRVYLGSARVMLPQGEHTYELVYRTDRQMGFFADHDELYWNVTGNGWDFPIDRATARILLPADIPVS